MAGSNDNRPAWTEILGVHLINYLYSPRVSGRVKTPVLRVLVPDNLVFGRTRRLDACNNSGVSVARVGKRDRSLISATRARYGGLLPWAGYKTRSSKCRGRF